MDVYIWAEHTREAGRRVAERLVVEHALTDTSGRVPDDWLVVTGSGEQLRQLAQLFRRNANTPGCPGKRDIFLLRLARSLEDAADEADEAA